MSSKELLTKAMPLVALVGTVFVVGSLSELGWIRWVIAFFSATVTYFIFLIIGHGLYSLFEKWFGEG